jgi:hypothetical protein
MKTTFIYALKDPDSGEVRYVGKSDCPEERLTSHLWHCHRTPTKKNNWLRKLLRENKRPNLDILDEVPYVEWPSWEVAYIEFFKSEGYRLVNGTLGGDHLWAGELHPWFNKSGAAHPAFGLKRSEETKNKIRLAISGEKHHAFGKVLSEEHKNRISNSMRGRSFSPEHRQKLSFASRGKPKSDAHKEKIREWKKTQPPPMKGKHHSEETKQKIREAALRQWRRS